MMKRKKRDPYRFFKIEVAELLEKMNQGFMKLEETPDDSEVLQALFREAHTLKGSSRLVGLSNIGEIAHWQEDFLGKVREGSAVVTSGDITRCLKALDHVELITQAMNKQETPELIDVSKTLALLKQSAEVATLEVTPQPISAEKEGQKVTSERELQSEISQESKAAPEEPPTSPQLAPQTNTSKEDETLRVSLKQLNTLLNYTGELFINKTKLEAKVSKLQELKFALSSMDPLLKCWQRLRLNPELQTLFSSQFDLQELSQGLEKQLETQQQLKSMFHNFIEEYQEDIKQTHAISLGLKDEAIRARMIPVKTLFTPFKRLVRDLAEELHKEIELNLIGEDILVDKQILDDIKAPLMHLIRNSIDHGLESPEERQQKGKKATGSLSLIQKAHGNTLTIICEDNGRGIDPVQIRSIALKKNIISAQELAEISDAEALYLILKPGFSTSKIVSSVSGRGVGLDVVNTVISQLRGVLSIESELGKYTRFILKFPQNLASLPCLLFRCGTEKLLIPLSVVVQTQHVLTQEVKTEGHQEMIQIDGKAIPLISMKSLLSLGEESDSQKKVPIILGQMKGEKLAFIVDQFMGVQEIVLKELDPHLRNIPNIGGASILGDGHVTVLLDPVELFDNANKNKKSSILQDFNAASQEKIIPEILVVDDSLTTRMMEKSILENAGYQVDIAVDAENALEKTSQKQYGLVITDVEMPGMNGFQLTKTLKNTEKYGNTPFIIVSSLSTPEVKRKGIDAGAQAYIVKGEFHQRTLLDLVESFI